MGREKTHEYRMQLRWLGNRGTGTSGYRDYSRDHEISAAGKGSALPCSSDAAFRGDSARYSPEEMLVGSLSSCHMLWLLHLCSDAGIVVVEYRDDPEGLMAEHPDGSGEFTSVTLQPGVTVAASSAARIAELEELHHRAHELCFISRSVNFPVRVKPAPVSVALDKGSSAYSGTAQ